MPNRKGSRPAYISPSHRCLLPYLKQVKDRSDDALPARCGQSKLEQVHGTRRRQQWMRRGNLGWVRVLPGEDSALRECTIGSSGLSQHEVAKIKMRANPIGTFLLYIGTTLFVAGTFLAFYGSDALAAGSYWMMVTGWSVSVASVAIRAYRFFKAFRERTRRRS